MKNALALVVAVVVLVAMPALAEDGNVPQATLSALGLSGMHVVSDSEGMGVRGMSSTAQATSLSYVSVNLFDPATGASLSFVSVDYSRATDENAGLNATSSAEASTTAGIDSIAVDINLYAADVYDAVISVLGVTGNAQAMSPFLR